MSKRKVRVSKVKVLTILLGVLCVIFGIMCYTIWCDYQDVFHDVTVELGTESLSMQSFMTDKAKAYRVSFVSDPTKIDLSKVGKTVVTLKHGIKTYAVTLTIQDTTAPTASIQNQYEVSVSDSFPEAKTLVKDIQDESAVNVYYAQEPVVPDDYSALDVAIVVEDACGNKATQNCRFQFYGWLRESYTLELGDSLTPDLLLTDPDKDSALIDQRVLDEVSQNIGTHNITVTSGNTQATCTVIVQDTTGPSLELQNVQLYPGEKTNLDDFIVSTSDISGEVQLRLVGDMPDCSEQGTYSIVIEAEDTCGNITKKEATLWVTKDAKPPVIQGAWEEMTVEKHSSPDFLEGVTATDETDGECEITVDTSTLDISVAGTYYITYSAIDNSGNIGTYKRKIVVEPNEEDTAALVQEIADSLPDDPELIRDYVRDNIGYSHNWGGDDPVWYGFTKNAGNCYVHALCLQALLENKGYETQLIWCTNESHYWLIIKLDIGWRHIDATPSYQHRKISLMTDAQRYANLNGRNWDRTKWPACE